MLYSTNYLGDCLIKCIYILEEALDLGGSDQSLSAISVIEYIIATTLSLRLAATAYASRGTLKIFFAR